MAGADGIDALYRRWIRNRPARGTEVMLTLQGTHLAAARTAAGDAASVV